MSRLFIILLFGVSITSCAISKNSTEKSKQHNKRYAFEYLPQVENFPQDLRLNKMSYVYAGGRILDGVLTNDGNYLLTGMIKRVEKRATDRYKKSIGNPFVIKMSFNGKILWQLAIDSVQNKPIAIKEADEYYALFSKVNTVTKIDKDGRLIEIINLAFEANSMSIVKNHFVYGNANKNTFSVTWTNFDGSIIEKNEIKNEKLRFSNSLGPDADHNCYAYGVYNEKKSDSTGIYVYKLSKTAQLWEKDYAISNEEKEY